MAFILSLLFYLANECESGVFFQIVFSADRRRRKYTLFSASAANAARSFGVPVVSEANNGVLPSERKWCLFFMGVPATNAVSSGVFFFISRRTLAVKFSIFFGHVPKKIHISFRECRFEKSARRRERTEMVINYFFGVPVANKVSNGVFYSGSPLRTQ